MMAVPLPQGTKHGTCVVDQHAREGSKQARRKRLELDIGWKPSFISRTRAQERLRLYVCMQRAEDSNATMYSHPHLLSIPLEELAAH